MTTPAAPRTPPRRTGNAPARPDRQRTRTGRALHLRHRPRRARSPLRAPAQPSNRPAGAAARLRTLRLPGANAWWGGPTSENFALVELARPTGPDDRWRPNGLERRFLTARTAVWLPGRDHAPSTPLRVRVFLGSLWLSADEVARYEEQGLALPASDDWLFDPEPSTLAARLRHAVAHGNAEG